MIRIGLEPFRGICHGFVPCCGMLVDADEEIKISYSSLRIETDERFQCLECILTNCGTWRWTFVQLKHH